MQIPSSFDVTRLSHAYIISAASPSRALAGARRMAAAALCADAAHAPCGKCRSCRKAFDGVHPDIITVSRPVDGKGNQKREIGVDQIRALSMDACVLPNESARKLYILDEADTMNLSAQNAALKLLEEPPAGVIFLLCVTNPSLLLPTVRSRCVELGLAGEEDAAGEESRKLAAQYLKAVASGDEAVLFRWCASQDAMDGRAAAAFADAVYQSAADMLLHRQKDPGLGEPGLLHVCALMERCRAYLKVNTGTKHIFGLLAVASIVGSGNRG